MADLSATVSLPAQWLAMIMPPVVEFGCPVQRSKDEREAWWHIPISVRPLIPRIGPSHLTWASPFIDLYDRSGVTQRLRLKWGDAAFQREDAFRDRENLHEGPVFLTPLVRRRDDGADLRAYLTDQGYFRGPATTTTFDPDRKKRRFRIGVQSGRRQVISKHFYLVRVPRGPHNSNFSVERGYEGAGTDPFIK